MTDDLMMADNPHLLDSNTSSVGVGALRFFERIEHKWALDVTGDGKVVVHGTAEAVAFVQGRLEKLERLETFFEDEHDKMASPAVEHTDAGH